MGGTDPPAGSGIVGVPDNWNLLACADRWLRTGEIGMLHEAIREQGWLAGVTDVCDTLRAAWVYRGQPADRGTGWRAWTVAPSEDDPRDAVAAAGLGFDTWDSRWDAWTDVPPRLVIAVSYLGADRIVSQSRDPYLCHGGRVYSHPQAVAAGLAEGIHEVGTGGLWVSDALMRRARWRALLAMTLED